MLELLVIISFLLHLATSSGRNDLHPNGLHLVAALLLLRRPGASPDGAVDSAQNGAGVHSLG